MVTGSPVLVPDDADDDDISILEVTDKSLLCVCVYSVFTVS